MNTGSPQLRGRFVAAAAVTAAVTSGLIYLLQHFVFHDDLGWIGVLIFFVVLFPLYLAGPWIGPRLRRFFHGPQGE